jgi:hypothetical protein
VQKVAAYIGVDMILVRIRSTPQSDLQHASKDHRLLQRRNSDTCELAVDIRRIGHGYAQLNGRPERALTHQL